VESGVKHHNPNPKENSTNQFNILPFSGTNKYVSYSQIDISPSILDVIKCRLKNIYNIFTRLRLMYI
jgi:hypothetical protein